ncbi:MAG: hypothetical protein AB8G96_17385 [Phycisphaerales bacterium]
MRFDLDTWTRHLRSVAHPLPSPGAPLGGADLEAAVQAVRQPSTIDAARPPGNAPSEVNAASAPGELALWWGRSDDRIDPAEVLHAAHPDRRAPNDDPAGTGGSLLPRDRYRAIEVWTDADLAACHALWWLAELAPPERAAPWRERLHAVRDWHLEHTQPDNATNRPWAVHVFLELGTRDGERYAETLLHNALALGAEPTPLARVLLADAADALERIAAR